MIRITGLSRTFRSIWRPGRAVRAIDGISLEIPAGSVVGLIGLNGAGKTTLLRLLLGYLRPTSGEIEIAGMAPRAFVERYGIGYVPEDVAIPGAWTVEGALQAYAMLGNAGADAAHRVDAALQRLGIEELRSRRVRHLSKGNLQRLAIAQALLCERDVLVLDEPTDGLDPVWIAELRAIIAEWRAGRPSGTVVIASHNLPQIEKIADRAVVLHQGRILAELALGPGGDDIPLELSFLRLMENGATAV